MQTDMQFATFLDWKTFEHLFQLVFLHQTAYLHFLTLNAHYKVLCVQLSSRCN